MPPSPSSPSRPARRLGWWLLVGLAAALGWSWAGRQSPGNGPPEARRAPPPVPVVTAPAVREDFPVYLTGLGTVTAFHTVTVRSRVDGQLVKVAFREGQMVREGDLLAEIDPRPFQVQLTQAEGQMARDRAQLRLARIQLERNRALLSRDYIAQQQVDSDLATLDQLEGAVKADQGQIDAARLQLTYTRITAPLSGRIGLRRVDPGNLVQAADPNGLAVITQLQPIAVIFSLPQDVIPRIAPKLGSGETLPVEAYDRDMKIKIASGTLLTTDNAIDPNTGTLRFKAVFPNQDNALFPNQFVNARLLADTLRDSVVVPAAAVQRGPDSKFVYLVRDDSTVTVRPIVAGPTEGDRTVVEKGLAGGERVVVEGVDKLREGARVTAAEAEPARATLDRPTP
ncbi:MdtA/MuxA family multidrug efflux RND transporter periplasmic adaptor subunit [Candidatus Methylocalor cossyra]|uniref:Multidrug efflux pump membrane fusion protein MdtA n=1 Tax=Candidatus Methylocalor cossyra TaxID=3108543 RepID=A0ABP1CAD5_9GAMM